MHYTQVHSRTVAEDYYAAMEVLEQRLEVELLNDVAPATEPVSVAERDALLKLADALAAPQLDGEARLELASQLRELVQD